MIGPMAAIEIEGLVKRFGHATALAGLDLTVRTGAVHGFLGPNGAGKSTTLRVLLGLLTADAGRVALLGGDPWRDAVALHRRLAYVPGDVTLWPNLSGGEIIDVLGGLRGGLDETRRAELVERFGLDPTKKGRAYSKGNRQKVALIAALACDVELYLFDEPTSGLDPLMEAEFQRCVRELRAAGRTVLLSSHILAEVEALCDAVSIVRDGRVVDGGSLDDLRHLTRTTIVARTAEAPGDLAALPGVHDAQVSDDGKDIRLSVDASALDAVMKALADHGVRRLESRPPTLEELFLRHYDEPAAAAAAAAAHA